MRPRTTNPQVAQQGIKRLALSLLFQSSNPSRSPMTVAINRLAGRIIESPSKATLPQVQRLGSLMRSLGPLDRDPDIEARAFLALSSVHIRSNDFIMRAAAAVERDSVDWNLRASLFSEAKNETKGQNKHI